MNASIDNTYDPNISFQLQPDIKKYIIRNKEIILVAENLATKNIITSRFFYIYICIDLRDTIHILALTVHKQAQAYGNS